MPKLRKPSDDKMKEPTPAKEEPVRKSESEQAEPARSTVEAMEDDGARRLHEETSRGTAQKEATPDEAHAPEAQRALERAAERKQLEDEMAREQEHRPLEQEAARQRRDLERRRQLHLRAGMPLLALGFATGIIGVTLAALSGGRVSNIGSVSSLSEYNDVLADARDQWTAGWVLVGVCGVALPSAIVTLTTMPTQDHRPISWSVLPASNGILVRGIFP